MLKDSFTGRSTQSGPCCSSRVYVVVVRVLILNQTQCCGQRVSLTVTPFASGFVMKTSGEKSWLAQSKARMGVTSSATSESIPCAQGGFGLCAPTSARRPAPILAAKTHARGVKLIQQRESFKTVVRLHALQQLKRETATEFAPSPSL